MKSKQKNLKQLGKGNKPKTADPGIPDDDIEKLFEAGELGTSSPASLLNSMWLNNYTLHFVDRTGGEENRHVQWGDVEYSYDEELELEYLEFL